MAKVLTKKKKQRMTGKRFRAIREQLGFTQEQFAKLLGYAGAIAISAFERETNPREIHYHLALLMEALEDGYWPKGWPQKKTDEVDGTAADTEGSGASSGDRVGHAEPTAQSGSNPVRKHRARKETGDAAI